MVSLGLRSEGFVGVSDQINTLDLESLWHNPAMPLDVNDDGGVLPLDALLVINQLNRANGESESFDLEFQAAAVDEAFRQIEDIRRKRFHVLDAGLAIRAKM